MSAFRKRSLISSSGSDFYMSSTYSKGVDILNRSFRRKATSSGVGRSVDDTVSFTATAYFTDSLLVTVHFEIHPVHEHKCETRNNLS